MESNWWRNYQQIVRGKTISHIAGAQNELVYWQDLLFFNFLFYCLPISFIAVIPGVFMAVENGYIIIALIDSICLLLLSVVTFFHQIPLKLRKFFIIAIFYALSVFLINLLGYMGPGVFYLFAITILTALVFTKRYAYFTILVNAFILFFFAAVIRYHLFHTVLNKEYSAGEWIAFSSNLIFLSVILVALIDRIFQSLQETIDTKGQLQERYKNIFDKSPIPMWIFDTRSLNFLEVNEAAIRHYGYSEAEFLQMTIKDIRKKDAEADLELLVKSNRESLLYYQGDAEHLQKNGRSIHVKIESNVLLLNGQQVRLVLATDVTDQVASGLEVFNTNLKIKRSEANLRAIFESAVDGFVLLDNELNIRDFNSKARDYIQLNKNQPDFKVNQNIIDYIDVANQALFIASVKEVMAGEIVEYERSYDRDKKSVQWVRFTLTPVIEDETIKGVCITGRDITVGKLYLQNLEDQNKTFKEISWMQSHLVRAPLARIMGLIDLLKTLFDDDFSEAVDHIITSAHELDVIIKKITLESNTILDKYEMPVDTYRKKN